MSNVRKIYNYFLSEDKELVRKLKPILGFTPTHIQLFKKAFYHRSMNHDDNGLGAYNNERLEFLGDAVLNSIVAEYLFKKYPNKDEGFLTKMRSKIVKRNTLNHIADSMGLDIILSEYSIGKMSNSMLGNALEAVVGAIYIEFGYNKTSDYVIKNILMKYLDIHQMEENDDNFKSTLLEWCQKHSKEIIFKVIAKSKYDKRDYFTVAAVIDGEEISKGEDFSKKSAEQKASASALHSLNIS